MSIEKVLLLVARTGRQYVKIACRLKKKVLSYTWQLYTKYEYLSLFFSWNPLPFVLYASGHLVVFVLQESGGYTLKGGPVDALISYAASSGKSGVPVFVFSLLESIWDPIAIFFIVILFPLFILFHQNMCFKFSQNLLN